MVITKPDGKRKYKKTASAEMSKEDNYNKIDGTFNNKSKPTLEQLKKEATKRQSEKTNEHVKKITVHSNTRDDETGARRKREATR